MGRNLVSLSLLILFAGCLPQAPFPGGTRPLSDRPNLPGNGRDAAAPVPLVEEFDFGPVLARGQTLRHEFTLTNPSDRPIRLLNATAFTPCCSSIGPLPESIPPGVSVAVPITLRAADQSGRKQLEFVVETDSTERPARKFVILVDLHPEWEEREIGEPSGPLPLGQSAERTIRFVCFRQGDEGLPSPVSVRAIGPLTAEFKGPAVDAIHPSGLVESTRDVAVIIPPSDELGPRDAEFRLEWPNGRSQVIPVHWEVAPLLRAVPSGLVLRPAGGVVTRPVVVAADDGTPFRILEVASPLLDRGFRPPPGASIRHRIDLPFAAARGSAEAGPSDLRITTDHPRQPVVSLTVMVLPGPEEGEGSPK